MLRESTLVTVFHGTIELGNESVLRPEEVDRANASTVIVEGDLKLRCREAKCMQLHSGHGLARGFRTRIREVERAHSANGSRGCAQSADLGDDLRLRRYRPSIVAGIDSESGIHNAHCSGSVGNGARVRECCGERGHPKSIAHGRCRIIADCVSSQQGRRFPCGVGRDPTVYTSRAPQQRQVPDQCSRLMRENSVWMESSHGLDTHSISLAPARVQPSAGLHIDAADDFLEKPLRALPPELLIRTHRTVLPAELEDGAGHAPTMGRRGISKYAKDQPVESPVLSGA